MNNKHSSSPPFLQGEEEEVLNQNNAISLPMQKKFLEVCIESESNWESFNRIADTLLSSSPDLESLLLLHEGYEKQSVAEEELQLLRNKIDQSEPKTPKEFFLFVQFLQTNDRAREAREYLEKGRTLFPTDENLLFTFIDICIEIDDFNAILYNFTPEFLEKMKNHHLYMIYLQSYLKVHSSITQETFAHLRSYFRDAQTLHPTDSDIYFLELSFIKRMKHPGNSIQELFDKCIQNRVENDLIFKQILAFSLLQQKLTLSLQEIDYLTNRTEDSWERCLLDCVRMIIEEFHNFGTAYYLWKQSLERKNKASTIYFENCIQVIGNTLELNSHLRNIDQKNRSPINNKLVHFILEAYKQIQLLTPYDNVILYRKIDFLKQVDPKAAEYELSNALKNNPTSHLLYQYAGLLYQQSRYSEAVMQYEKIDYADLSWQDSMQAKAEQITCLSSSGLEESLFGVLQELERNPLQSPETLYSIAYHNIKKYLFWGTKEGLEEAKKNLALIISHYKPNRNTILLMSTVYRMLHQIPKAISVLDKYENQKDLVICFRRACLLYEMFKETGHTKYLEDADYELSIIQFPTYISESLLALLPESIIHPSTLQTTTFLTQPNTESSFLRELSSENNIPGKISCFNYNPGMKFHYLSIGKKAGAGNFVCTTPYPYSMESEWNLIHDWLQKVPFFSSEHLLQNDWYVSTEPLNTLPFEPSSVRFQIAMGIASSLHNADISSAAFLIEQTDTNGIANKSEKVYFLLQRALHKKESFKAVVVPLANLSDMIELYLEKPENSISFWIATSSFFSCADLFFAPQEFIDTL